MGSLLKGSIGFIWIISLTLNPTIAQEKLPDFGPLPQSQAECLQARQQLMETTIYLRGKLGPSSPGDGVPDLPINPRYRPQSHEECLQEVQSLRFYIALLRGIEVRKGSSPSVDSPPGNAPRGTPGSDPVPFGGSGQPLPGSPALPKNPAADNSDDLKKRIVGTWEGRLVFPDGSILLERSSYDSDGRESGSGTMQPPNKSLPPIAITYHGKWDIRKGYLYSFCEQSSIPICGFEVGAKILQLTDTELTISFLGSTLTYVRVSRK